MKSICILAYEARSQGGHGEGTYEHDAFLKQVGAFKTKGEALQYLKDQKIADRYFYGDIQPLELQLH